MQVAFSPRIISFLNLTSIHRYTYCGHKPYQKHHQQNFRKYKAMQYFFKKLRTQRQSHLYLYYMTFQEYLKLLFEDELKRNKQVCFWQNKQFVACPRKITL